MKFDFELLLWAIVMAACLFGGIYIGRDSMQREAIQRGYAHYNPTNGVWQWKEGTK